MPSTPASPRARRQAPLLALALALAAPVSLCAQAMEVELTPLSAAASRGDTAAVRALLDAGTDADSPDDLGWTALMWAAIGGRPHVARLLLERDASCVCTRDPEGKTALIHAAIHGSTEVARLLLEAGADLQAADTHGFTALDHAETNGRAAVAALLRRHAAALPRPGGAAPADSAAAPDTSTVAPGAAGDVAARDDTGWTALMWAAYEGHAGIAALLRSPGPAPVAHQERSP